MNTREALFSLLEVVRDPRAVMAEVAEPPDPVADGDAAMLYRARRTFALLILDNNRLREEVRLRVAEVDRLIRGKGPLS